VTTPHRRHDRARHEGDRERCLAAGMDEYISKPIAADTLFKTIGTLVPSFCKTGKEFTDADEGGDEVHFDRAGLLKAFDDDWDFLVEAVEMFFTDFPPCWRISARRSPVGMIRHCGAPPIVSRECCLIFRRIRLPRRHWPWR
jgi:hypothetical protein